MTLEEMHQPFCRWAKKGKTPTVRFKQKNQNSATFFGSLSLKTKREIPYLGENRKAIEFIAWLEEVVKRYEKEIRELLPAHLSFLKTQKDYQGLILVVLDGASCHTSVEVKEWLDKHYGIIELLRFPTYSPNLNPQEHVWKAVRKNLAKVKGKYSFKQTVDRACRILLTKTFNYKFV